LLQGLCHLESDFLAPLVIGVLGQEVLIPRDSQLPGTQGPVSIGEDELALVLVTSLWKVDHVPVALGDSCARTSTPQISPRLEESCHLAKWMLLEFSDLKEGSASLLEVAESVVDPAAQKLGAGSLGCIEGSIGQHTVEAVQCAREVSLRETCDGLR